MAVTAIHTTGAQELIDSTAIDGDLQLAAMNMPRQFSMSDLVPLLYRPRVARFGLSGELRSRTAESGSRVWQERESFEIDPDGQYRSEVIDDDGDRAVETGDSAEGRVPLPELMISTRRLLHDFDLQVTGQTEFLSRPVIAITGSPRRTRRHVTEQVSGLVDAELGIFLRYQHVSSSQTENVEFTRLTVSPPKPQGVEQDSGPLPSSPAAPVSPAPAEPALTDDQLNLLYRSDLGPQRFAAQLRERTDVVTVTRLSREAVAATKFGSKTQWLWGFVDDHPLPNVDMVARLAVDMPERYLIEAISDPGPKPTVIACNGRRLWRAYRDRVAVRAAEPLPDRLTAIIDPSWLLDRGVSVIGQAEVAGRPALHVRAVGDWLSPRSGTLSGTLLLSDRVDAFIDRALGICLRLVCSYQDQLIARIEMAGLTTEVEPAMFEFVPPTGVKVITGGLLAEIGQTPASLAFHIAKGTAGMAVEIGRRWINRK